MLWLQVGTIDLNRPATKAGSKQRVIRVSLRWTLICLLGVVLSVLTGLPNALAQSKGRKGKPRGKTGSSSSTGEQSLTNIPLPIGHEAKGLVLPDFDGEGHLRGKFEAGTARRIDEEHVGFEQLKISPQMPLAIEVRQDEAFGFV